MDAQHPVLPPAQYLAQYPVQQPVADRQRSGRARVWRLVLLLPLLLFSYAVLAVGTPQLVDVRYRGSQPGLSEFELQFDSPAPEPQVQWAQQPHRLVLTFMHTTPAQLAVRPIPVAENGIRHVAHHSEQGITRVVFYLEQPLAWAGAVEGNRYRISLSPDASQLAALTDYSDAAGPTPDGAGQVNRIQGLDFRRGAGGEGILQLSLGSEPDNWELRQQGEQLELAFYNSTIADELLYRLDVNDFATPVAAVETFRDQSDVRIRIEPGADYHYDYRQQGDQLSVMLHPTAAAAGSGLADRGIKSWGGDLISLSFQDIPVRNVLQILAEFNGFNLITSDSVTGNITLHLKQVPWDQALSQVLSARGLARREEGSIMLVAPADELAEREAQALQSARQAEELKPLYTELLPVSYARATELAALLKDESSSLLSERGSVTVDERTNTLLVQESRQRLQQVRELVMLLDVPVRQVQIEARMVTVKSGHGLDLGAQFGLEESRNGSGGSLNLDLSLDHAPTAGLVSKLSDALLLDLELSAMEEENMGEVIASPRLTTADQKQAEIRQGVQIPYSVATDQGVSIEFQDAVLMLRVTPQITPDHRMILDLEVRQDSVGRMFDTGVGIDTQQIITQVLADNGQTIVLGGIYQQVVRSEVRKVPLLGDIPLLGSLFRKTVDKQEKSEVLIFVTPRIVDQGLLQPLPLSRDWTGAPA